MKNATGVDEGVLGPTLLRQGESRRAARHRILQPRPVRVLDTGDAGQLGDRTAAGGTEADIQRTPWGMAVAATSCCTRPGSMATRRSAAPTCCSTRAARASRAIAKAEEKRLKAEDSE